MLLANIIKATSRLKPAINCQQVRHARKTFAFRTNYGVNPILSEDDHSEALESGQADKLTFERIRFATSYESNSPLFDQDLEVVIRRIMHDGRLGLYYSLMHDTFYKIKSIQYVKARKLKESETKQVDEDGNEITEIETNPMVLFKKALKNCEPVIITRKVRRGGATYQVPYPLKTNESEYFGRSWLIEAVAERPKPRRKRFYEAMAQEILDAAAGKGKVVKRRDDMHKLADANKAYAHYRWG